MRAPSSRCTKTSASLDSAKGEVLLLRRLAPGLVGHDRRAHRVPPNRDPHRRWAVLVLVEEEPPLALPVGPAEHDDLGAVPDVFALADRFLRGLFALLDGELREEHAGAAVRAALDDVGEARGEVRDLVPPVVALARAPDLQVVHEQEVDSFGCDGTARLTQHLLARLPAAVQEERRRVEADLGDRLREAWPALARHLAVAE